jgi:hypothetical protein
VPDIKFVVEKGVTGQEANFHADHELNGLSDAGSLNSKEEHELEEYFKKIEEENRGQEVGKDLSVQPSGAELAAIPEASPKLAGATRSKRRTSESDVDVAGQAERIKALQNEGNQDSASVASSFHNVSFAANLENPGIVLGTNETNSSQSILEIRKALEPVACGSMCLDKKNEVLDLEESVRRGGN